MNYGIETFDKTLLDFDPTGKKYITFNSYHRLFSELLHYVAKNLEEDQGASYLVDVLPKRKQEDDEDEDKDENHKKEGEEVNDENNDEKKEDHSRISLRIGYGQYRFKSFEGETLHAVYQHLGKPVGNGCGVELMSNLIIFTDKSVDVLSKFLTTLVERSEVPEEGKFTCFKWNIQNQYWQEDVRINTRSIESVVLPKATKDKLIHDIEKFLSKKTRNFYHRNGIPYRRSYLFYGIPGSGKTSLVQAIASYFERNLCYLIPTHPDITDDSLREAMNQLPANSIVIFEDIDALFTLRAKNQTNRSSLTFSGLLNALDGIGSPAGQIFILTTNLRDHLDDALIRNGRVDLHIEFSYAITEQMEQMWRNFYPDPTSAALASQFSSKVQNALKAKQLQVSTAGLQHFFITQMDHTAEEALEHIHVIIDEIQLNHTRKMLEALRGEEKKKEGEEEVVVGEEKKEGEEGATTTGQLQQKKSKKQKKTKKISQEQKTEAVVTTATEGATTNSASPRSAVTGGGESDAAVVVESTKAAKKKEKYQEYLRKKAERQAERQAERLAAKKAAQQAKEDEGEKDTSATTAEEGKEEAVESEEPVGVVISSVISSSVPAPVTDEE